MGLLVLDRAPAAEDLLEEDLDLLCQCPHSAGDHDPDGCRACVCGARGLTPEGLEDDAEFETEVARVTAALRAARSRQTRILEDRADAIAKDPTRSPRSNRPRVTPATGPTTKPTTARIVRKVAPSSPLPTDGYERAAWQHPDEELLEAVGVLA
jgi:hypothetical protein